MTFVLCFSFVSENLRLTFNVNHLSSYEMIYLKFQAMFSRKH